MHDSHYPFADSVCSVARLAKTGENRRLRAVCVPRTYERARDQQQQIHQIVIIKHAEHIHWMDRAVHTLCAARTLTHSITLVNTDVHMNFSFCYYYYCYYLYAVCWCAHWNWYNLQLGAYYVQMYRCIGSTIRRFCGSQFFISPARCGQVVQFFLLMMCALSREIIV